MSLDAERARRVADVLEPFSVLPERLTPVGIYRFCTGLREIARENQVEAYRTFDAMIARFQDPRFYPTLPADARIIYVTASHFARGAMAIFRGDGGAALESADRMEQSGMKLYAMLASQLRYLYHANRGELALAAQHRERVDLYAAQIGSATQVDLWEAPSLLPLHVCLGDVVALARTAKQVENMQAGAPSLKRYGAWARAAMACGSEELMKSAEYFERVSAASTPRSYIGWTFLQASIIARGFNQAGASARAEAHCLRTLAQVSEDDREYVTLYLDLDIQLAYARAGLGRFEDALEHLDRLIERFTPSAHPLALGSLHEARAYIAWEAGRRLDARYSMAQVRRWFGQSGTPALIAKGERLAALDTEHVGEGAEIGRDDQRHTTGQFSTALDGPRGADITTDLTTATGVKLSARGPASSEAQEGGAPSTRPGAHAH
jgi:hypothetical protein